MLFSEYYVTKGPKDENSLKKAVFMVKTIREITLAQGADNDLMVIVNEAKN
ncbi:hypothetical protein [Lactobacillus gasseri]|jgi:hypothetical protein|uniref:hypothetical protein n=1 Tax=Lactobacillus gasseri TaxID=1596 RepID=UPI000A6C442F|nr:hypothetical protein [Lactobacillus gasseri]WEA89467.1 hypothetical protein PUW43_10050 [Lactobacillus gasseri]